MLLDQLRALFHLGELTCARILPVPNSTGWYLEVGRQGDTPLVLIKNRADPATQNKRVFASVDAAVNAAREIGFSTVQVCIPTKDVQPPEEFKLL